MSKQELFKITTLITNVYLIRGERAVIVDASVAGNERRILAQLAQHGVKPQDVSLLLLTHGHADHFGSVAALHAATGAPVAIGRADAAMLASGHNPLHMYPTRPLGRITRQVIAQSAPGYQADVLIDGETSLAEYGVDAKVVPLPGHTAGSVFVLLPNGDAIVGDTLSGGFVTHTPTYPYFTDDVPTWQQSLRTLTKLATGTIYPAHGQPTTAAAITQRFGSQIKF